MLFTPNDRVPADFAVVWIASDGTRFIQRFPKLRMAERFLDQLEKDLGLHVGYVSPYCPKSYSIPYFTTVQVKRRTRAEARVSSQSFKDYQRIAKARAIFKMIGEPFESCGNGKEDFNRAQQALVAFDRQRASAAMNSPGGRTPSRKEWAAQAKRLESDVMENLSTARSAT